MLRRAFLKTSSLLISGVPLSTMAGLQRPQRMWSPGAESTGFSLDVVTDRPGTAVRLIDRLLGSSVFQAAHIRFEEAQLVGSHIGDIALVRSLRLIDFRGSDDGLSHQLSEVARSLGLPSRCDNPTLLRFYSGSQVSTPQFASVFCGEVLVHQLPLDRDMDAFRIDGVRGHLDLSVRERSVRVAGASCKHKTCMELGAISRPGQTLVCIPAQISVAIEGHSDSGVDSVTY